MRGLIVGKTYDRAYTRMENIIKDYEFFWNIKPRWVVKNKYTFQVEFENNDIWHAISMNSNSRGRKCNILLIDENIPQEFRGIFEACVINRPYSGISYY